LLELVIVLPETGMDLVQSKLKVISDDFETTDVADLAEVFDINLTVESKRGCRTNKSCKFCAFLTDFQQTSFFFAEIPHPFVVFWGSGTSPPT